MTIKRGSLEATKWIEKFKFNTKLKPITQRIYNFVIYRKMINTFSDEDILYLTELWDKSNLTHAINFTYLRVHNKRISEMNEKRRLINSLLNPPPKEQEFLREMERWSNLSDEEISLKRAEYPDGSDNTPLSILYEQPNLKVEKRGDVDVIIKDKIYNKYSALITSNARFKNQKRSYHVVLHSHYDKDLFPDNHIGLLIDEKVKEEQEYYNKVTGKTTEKQRKSLSDVDISHVKEAMGFDNIEQNVINQDLSGDIF